MLLFCYLTFAGSNSLLMGIGTDLTPKVGGCGLLVQLFGHRAGVLTPLMVVMSMFRFLPLIIYHYLQVFADKRAALRSNMYYFILFIKLVLHAVALIDTKVQQD